jgi:hypothetical protein
LTSFLRLCALRALALLLTAAFVGSLAAPHCVEATVLSGPGAPTFHTPDCCDHEPSNPGHEHDACLCPCSQASVVAPASLLAAAGVPVPLVLAGAPRLHSAPPQSPDPVPIPA